MFISRTPNTENGKQYIGMTSRDESVVYFGSGKHLKRALAKHVRKAFNREILERCESFEAMCEADIRWIGEATAVDDLDYYTPSGWW